MVLKKVAFGLDWCTTSRTMHFSLMFSSLMRFPKSFSESAVFWMSEVDPKLLSLKLK